MVSSPAVLLTDFGAGSIYPGVMKGVISSIAPRAAVIDLAHGIAPGDIAGAAFSLLVSYRYFPAASVFVCVVDPGVGTGRRVICARRGKMRFLAPDNGLLGYVAGEDGFDEVREVSARRLFMKDVSGTFHGRDIFAPVAARLASGLKFESLGPEISDMRRLEFPRVTAGKSFLKGTIVHVDVYGNCITNIRNGLDNGGTFYFNGVGMGKTVRSYGFAGRGDPAVVEGSSGFVELAVNGGSFAAEFKASRGDSVLVKYHER